MAKKKSSKGITYDSKETKTILGLVVLLMAIFFFVSIFTVSEQNSNLFVQTYNIFGKTTLLFSAFLLLVGLRLLGTNWDINSTRTLFAQLVVIILIPALLTAFTNTAEQIVKVSPNDVPGGYVGYYVIKEIFGDIFPTQPATKIILLVLTLFFTPLALAVPFMEVVNKLKQLGAFLYSSSNVLFKFNEDVAEEKLTESVSKDINIGKLSSYADLNKLIKKPEATAKANKDEDSDQLSLQEVKKIVKEPSESQINVNIKEASIGEEGLHQDTLKFPNWQFPPLSLLIPYKKNPPKDPNVTHKAKIIEEILLSFKIEASVVESFIGPSVIQYALAIPLGIRVPSILGLSENIALALGVDAKAIRIENIQGTSYLGIEVPRSERDLVRYKEAMESDEMKNSKGLAVPIGKGINGEFLIGRIEKMPHLLIAGATGSGKSVLTNTFITSLIMTKTPDEVKLILVDPKQVEFSDYNGIPHLLTPVITDMDKVINALKWAVNEMETRYSVFREEQGVRNIEDYNDRKGFAAMPYIIIVIDEMADMMMTANRNEAENAIVRLAQKARAVGIHLILATQRPSVNVITGIIKANIPGRVGMSVTSSTDSRVILDRIGAESLMGYGDLLYKAPDKTKSERLQGPFLESSEVSKVVDFLRSQAPEVEYVTEILERHLSDEEAMGEALGEISGDNLVEQAIRVVAQTGKASASYLQRRLKIGFNRAATLIDELEEAGVVGPPNGSKPREVLVQDADEFIRQLKGGV